MSWFNIKKNMQQAYRKHAHIWFLSFMFFIYSSIFFFQILRWFNINYIYLFYDFHIKILLWDTFPTPKIQEVYYFYTSTPLTNRLLTIIYNFFFYQFMAFWVLFLKILLWICWFFNAYIITIDLLLDLTRLFIFYADTSVEDFARKHPKFDSKTEFFVDERLINLISYINSTIPNYYAYIPCILIKKYDYICLVIWKYVSLNFPNVALLYTAFSVIYFICLLYMYIIISALDIVAMNYFSVLIFFTGITGDLLYWCYPWLYRYDFLNSFSIPVYVDFLHSHKHPRGVNILLLFFISNFLDKILNVNIIPRFCSYVLVLFLKLKNAWMYLKSKKLLFFTFMVVFLALPKIS